MSETEGNINMEGLADFTKGSIRRGGLTKRLSIHMEQLTAPSILSNYMQVVDMSDEEKIAIYMKLSKKKIIEMLLACHKTMDTIFPVLSYIHNNIKGHIK